LEVKVNLGYDVSCDLGLDTSGNYDDLFEVVIAQMLENNEISIERDRHNIARLELMHLRNLGMWNLMYKLYLFLRDRYNRGESTRYMTIYDQFSNKTRISREIFDEVVLYSEKLKMIEVLEDEEKMMRILRPVFQIHKDEGHL
jgi:hypothetical protein